MIPLLCRIIGHKYEPTVVDWVDLFARIGSRGKAPRIEGDVNVSDYEDARAIKNVVLEYQQCKRCSDFRIWLRERRVDDGQQGWKD